MKRLGFLAVLIMLTSSADAGSVSFNVGRHRVQIERHCRSASCTSISISRNLDWRRKRLEENRDADIAPKPPPPAPQMVSPPRPPVPPPPSAPPAITAPAKAVVAASPPAVYTTAATRGEIVAAPPLPPPPAPPPVQQVSVPLPPAPATKPAETAQPAPAVEQVAHRVEEAPQDSPIGDWLTEGKGTVRIAKCGHSLCGYVLTPSNEKGEAILINMKPKTERRWTGSVYSQDSGETYYGTMAMKGDNTLRVEACALSRFYCSGNNWSRIARRADNLVTSWRHPPALRA
jgi:uncharacterized protein (DUF2147 family)